MQFHETGYGKAFFGGQLPALINAINDNTEAIQDKNKKNVVNNTVFIVEENNYVSKLISNTIIGTFWNIEKAVAVFEETKRLNSPKPEWDNLEIQYLVDDNNVDYYHINTTVIDRSYELKITKQKIQ